MQSKHTSTHKSAQSRKIFAMNTMLQGIQSFLANPAKSGSGQIFGRISRLEDFNTAAVHANYLQLKVMSSASSILRLADFHAAPQNSLFATEFAACRRKTWKCPLLATFISNSRFYGLLFNFTFYHL